MDLGNATLSWYRLFVSPARGEVPKVDLGNATLSWYRLYRLHAGRFQKWTLGMLLCLGIVCLCVQGGSKSGPRECNFVLVSFVCIACAQGGSKSGPRECNLVFALIMHYQRVDARS